MARYVDGFILPLPRKNLAAYRKMATRAGKVWREHGAIEYIECIADDVKKGKVTSFPQGVKLKAGEIVVFEGWTLRVESMDRRRIAEVRVQSPTFLRSAAGNRASSRDLPQSEGR
jgi:uncharacterized protein YbaA (DUF1428 family)